MHASSLAAVSEERNGGEQLALSGECAVRKALGRKPS
jgi:hypothetical protein